MANVDTAMLSDTRTTSAFRFPIRFSLLFFVIVLSAGYLAAPYLPVAVGWENGPIENTQAVLLFLGGVWAVWRNRTANSPQQRTFWLLISPIWFLMVARELSWGAVFCKPLTFSVETGPTFSSTQQLWYKPAIAPAILALLIYCLWLFVKTRQSQTVAKLWRSRSLPLLEIVLFVICMFASAIAEGHMGMNLNHLTEGAAQIFEEAAELCAYTMLLLAQYRVARCLKANVD